MCARAAVCNVRAIIRVDACIFVHAVFVHQPACSRVRAPLNRAMVSGRRPWLPFPGAEIEGGGGG